MMGLHHVKYSKEKSQMFVKGQFKIQQMVFILVAVIILFGIVSIFFVSIRFGSLSSEVEEERKGAIFAAIHKMAGTPEFNWIQSDDCAACIDIDKLILLKNRTAYKDFWKDISLLKVVRIYPNYNVEECTLGNYPECNSITLVQGEDYESYQSFVSLCRYDGEIGQTRCDMGKIIMGFEGVK